MNSAFSTIAIKQDDLNTLKKSSASAQHFLRQRGLKGWPLIQSIPASAGQPAKLNLITK